MELVNYERKSELLTQLDYYKSLIDFKDSMEKNNYKWVNQYITKNIKKENFSDCEIILDNVINNQISRNLIKQEYFSKIKKE